MPPTRIPEAILTVHDDLGAPGQIIYSIDLDMETNPDATSIPYCDLVVLTLFNIARRQPEEFSKTYLDVVACLGEFTGALERGAPPEELAAIREKYGVEFRA